MRTAITLAGGLVLWGVSLGLARLIGGASAAAATTATVAFVAVWLVVAAVNLWLGVAKAGYTVREELPIFLLIFLVPAAVAVLVRWKPW